MKIDGGGQGASEFSPMLRTMPLVLWLVRAIPDVDPRTLGAHDFTIEEAKKLPLELAMRHRSTGLLIGLFSQTDTYDSDFESERPDTYRRVACNVDAPAWTVPTPEVATIARAALVMWDLSEQWFGRVN